MWQQLGSLGEWVSPAVFGVMKGEEKYGKFVIVIGAVGCVDEGCGARQGADATEVRMWTRCGQPVDETGTAREAMRRRIPGGGVDVGSPAQSVDEGSDIHSLSTYGERGHMHPDEGTETLREAGLSTGKYTGHVHIWGELGERRDCCGRCDVRAPWVGT